MSAVVLIASELEMLCWFNCPFLLPFDFVNRLPRITNHLIILYSSECTRLLSFALAITINSSEICMVSRKEAWYDAEVHIDRKTPQIWCCFLQSTRVPRCACSACWSVYARGQKFRRVTDTGPTRPNCHWDSPAQKLLRGSEEWTIR